MCLPRGCKDLEEYLQYSRDLHADRMLQFRLQLGWKLCTCLTQLLFPHWCRCWHVVLHENQESFRIHFSNHTGWLREGFYCTEVGYRCVQDSNSSLHPFERMLPGFWEITLHYTWQHNPCNKYSAASHLPPFFCDPNPFPINLQGVISVSSNRLMCGNL